VIDLIHGGFELTRTRSEDLTAGTTATIFSITVISIPPEDENFLRLNFYSKVRWRVAIDPTSHYFDSKFEIKTTVHKQAEWRKNLTAAR
jgi:hypothetical protein